MERRRFNFVLANTEKDDFDETELYQEGVEEELFNGALPWSKAVGGGEGLSREKCVDEDTDKKPKEPKPDLGLDRF